MNSRLLNQNPKTLAIIFESGDEVIAGLKKTAVDYKLAASHFTAIGALKVVTLGFFDLQKRNYKKIIFREQVEVLSLIGDIALKDTEPQIHAHTRTTSACMPRNSERAANNSGIFHSDSRTLGWSTPRAIWMRDFR